MCLCNDDLSLFFSAGVSREDDFQDEYLKLLTACTVHTMAGIGTMNDRVNFFQQFVVPGLMILWCDIHKSMSEFILS